MKNQKNKSKRTKVLSLLLVTILFLTYSLTDAEASYAAAPRVTTDETAYVNLDYYGKTKDVSVVKGCDLNGNLTFTDYGNYLSVTNMSGYEKPVLTASGVTWNLKASDKKGRFYYKCNLRKDAIEFPWLLDVSYKLNGKPIKAEKLAGASGLIEINIKATPNPKTKEYYRNNMLLQIAVTVDMDDNYSLEAPGAQLQTMGSQKVVVFAALPGDEDSYTIRIGTDSFETDGITAMMVPGTLESLKDIKDLKEDKDDVEDATDDMYAATNEMLITMESMNSGLTDLKTGTEGMEKARQHFSSGDDKMYDDIDATLEDLNAVNNQLENLIPYFETGQRMIRAMNKDIDELSDLMEDLQDPMGDTSGSVAVMQGDLKDLKKMLATLNGEMGDTLESLGKVAEKGGATEYEATQLQGQAQMARTLSEHMDSLNSLLNQTIAMGDTTKDIMDISNDLIDETVDLTDTLDQYEDDMIDMLDDMEELTSLTNNSLNSMIVLMNYSKNLIQETSDIMDPAMQKTLVGTIDLLQKSISNMDDIAAMRKANTTIKKTIDHQMDKFEDENKFLYLDAEAPLQSFTSDQNPSPSSTQIMLRTAEISLDDSSDISDKEVPRKDIGIFNRIKNVFVKIWHEILAVF